MADQTSNLTFIQYAIPPLKAGEYTIGATQTITLANATPELNTFTASKEFAVPGNRFQLNGDDIVSVFPANLSNGEYTGVMPLAVIRRDTLPWQRTSVSGNPTAPWLALLLFDDPDDLPVPEVTTGVAADLFPKGTEIEITGSSAVAGTGTMPAGTVSYPGMNPLDYGQSPSDPCIYIDLPISQFSRVCPSAADLPFLAHIRLTDTYDATDNNVVEQRYSVVLGNRWPRGGTQASAFLVSLENMGSVLPGDDGSTSTSWPAGAATVRLVCFRAWSYFANAMGEQFQSLCEHLNRDSVGVVGLTTVRLDAPSPDAAAVQTALVRQASGDLTDADSDVLVNDALCMGYTALDHDLREAGHTVTWCRGPLAPFSLTEYTYEIAACPDALLRYDPQTGMFDATYAQAWQLGQLLALQSTSFSVSLYNWKQTVTRSEAAQAEMAIILEKLGPSSLSSTYFARPSARLAETPPVPQDIADWLGRLKLLKGVPFAALVPDEAMLPVESLRFFYLDQDWTAALVDGAFSIGRAGSSGTETDSPTLAQANTAARGSARRMRKNLRPNLAARQAAAGTSEFETITGCMLRSQLVSGWPGLNVNGYDVGNAELPKLRMERLSNDVLICLFEGAVTSLTISEAPEQLHCGVEGDDVNGFVTDLRYITGTNPGDQCLENDGVPATVAVPVRADHQTLQASGAAEAIKARLNAAPYNQNLTTFTSAEFALEMVKGVVKVEYNLQ